MHVCLTKNRISCDTGEARTSATAAAGGGDGGGRVLLSPFKLDVDNTENSTNFYRHPTTDIAITPPLGYYNWSSRCTKKPSDEIREPP